QRTSGRKRTAGRGRCGTGGPAGQDPMRRLVALLAVLLLPGCSRTPLSYLDATSPVGGAIANLGLGLTAISVGVCVVVGVLLVIAIWRRRPGGDLEIAPINDRAAIRWIGIGVAISTVFLLGSAVWTLFTVNSIG